MRRMKLPILLSCGLGFRSYILIASSNSSSPAVLGMVFKVFRGDSTTPLALKIARRRLMNVVQGDTAKALSPVSEAELKALERLSHPNVVRLYDAIEEPGTDHVLCDRDHICRETSSYQSILVSNARQES